MCSVFMRRECIKMKKEKAYCQCCDKDVRYVTVDYTDTITIRGEIIEYNFIRAFCKHCGELVFPVSIGRKNDLSMYDAYKKRVNLLTSEEIIKIRRKLGLTQTGLAERMGCGLKTITRYENGAIQDRVFDNFIRCLDELYDMKQKSKQTPKEKKILKSKHQLKFQ